MVNMHFYRIVEWYLEYQLSVGINAKVAVWITKLVLEKHTIAITTLNPVKAYLYFCEQMLTKVLSALLSGHMLLENTIPTRSDTVFFLQIWKLNIENGNETKPSKGINYESFETNPIFPNPTRTRLLLPNFKMALHYVTIFAVIIITDNNLLAMITQQTQFVIIT